MNTLCVRVFGIALGVLALLTATSARAVTWTADAYTLATGDFNNDGKDDLLVIAKDPSLPSGIALGDGSGQPSVLSQSWASNYLGITWSGGTYIPHIGDFDGDNRDDIFLQRVSGGNHYVLMPDANNQFTSIHQTITNADLDIAWSAAERRIEVGDFNNNGLDDLYLQSNTVGVDNAVLLAVSGGYFSSVAHTWANAYLTLEWALAKAIDYAGDFNGDGRSDLLVQAKPNWVMIPFDDLSIPVPTYRSESYGIGLSDATGKVTSISDTWNHDNLGLEWSPLQYNIFVGNFNGDADGAYCADVLLQAKRAGMASYIVLMNCAGTVPTGATVYTLSPGYLGLNWDATSYQFQIGDFNGDGRSDVYMQAPAGGTNRIAYTASNGNITATPATHAPSGNFKKPVAGTIPGAFRVGDQGGASYSMPIEAPAGAGGLSPGLALVYDQMAGNGLAGGHWQLAGLSAITRCPTTYAQDGSVAPVNNTSTDRFCLDGNRLVTVGTYGAAGTEYKTEMETFQRIVQMGTQGGGPLSFRVDHPNGLMSYYGTTEDSRAGTAPDVVRAWYLSYREDQFGNRINYTYSENASTGETVPVEIAWTQNTATPTPKYKVTITYESRPAEDQRAGYDAGAAPWARTKRIDKLDVTYSGSQIRTYDLTYNPAQSPGAGTGRSQLKQVQVCGPDECMPPTAFATQSGTSGWQSGVATNVDNAITFVGDVNGDGRQDVFAPGLVNWRVFFGNSTGAFDTDQDTGVALGSFPQAARVIDYDADGLSELVFPTSTTWKVLRWTGSGFTGIDTGVSGSSPNNAEAADFDGDGRQDWIYNQSGGIYWRRNTGGSFAAPQLLATIPSVSYYSITNVGAPDINGDGRADLMVRWQDCVPYPPPETTCYNQNKLSVLVASGSSYTTVWSAIDSSGTVLRTGDINGDRLDDLGYFDGSTWYTLLSVGTGFVTASSTGIGSGPVIITDYDNDGRADLLRASGDYWYVYRSTGSTWSTTYTEAIPSAYAGTFGGFVGDASGDGFPEILSWSGSMLLSLRHKSALPDVVTTFTNGLSAPTNVTYVPLTDASVYTKNNVGTPPAFVRAFNGARYVVASETHDNGIGGTRRFDHKYDTAYVNTAGRGWLSFYSHRVDETRTGSPTPPPGQRTVRTLDRTFPTAGLPVSDVVTLNTAAAEQIVTTTNVLSTVAEATLASPARYFPRVEQTTSSDFGLGASALRTAVSNPTFDTNSGAVSTVTKTVSQTSPTAQTFTSTTTFNPTNIVTGTEYCLGLPGLVTTTNTLPDSTTASRKLNHTFYSATCALYQMTDESDSNTAKQLRTTFTYDAYGNVDVVSQDSVTSSQLRSADFNFDGDAQFPTLVTRGGVDLPTELTWNYLLGQRASVKGPDGLATSFSYDNFGRIKRAIRPVGSTDFSYDECYVCWPQNARLYVHFLDSDGHDGYRYLDRLQRPVGQSWTLPLGTQGRRETRYDAWGRVDKVSQPYVSYDPTFWVTYQYDNLNRVLQEDAPVSEAQTTGATTTYQYPSRDVWVTDAENHLTKYEHNALGQIAKVIDAMGGATTYTYRHFGGLGTVTDAESKLTTINYDARGFKSSMVDPNMGAWNYEYNIYGELTKQQSPNTTSGTFCAPGVWTVCLAYDSAGRPTSRVEYEGTTTFTYYTAGVGAKGKPYQTSATNFVEQFTYNPDHGATSQIRRTIEGTAYDFDMTFDSQGRLNVLTYPTSTTGYRFAVDYDYDSFGHLNVVKDAASGSTFYTLTEADALGRDVRVDLGDYATGLDEYRTFDRATGNLKDIDAGPSLSSTIQNLSFTYDEVGNVKTRTNNLIGKTETLTYDSLNRLTNAAVNGLTAVTAGYSASGRITSKSDCGSYTYGSSSHPYAVTNACGQTYAYDDGGRMVTNGSDTFTWFTYDLPKKLAVGTKTAEFFYGTDRQRYKQIQQTGTTTDATIYYVGTLFEKEVAGANTSYRHHVSAGDRVIAMVNRVGSTNTVQYLHRDLQGSVVEVTNATGGLVQSLAYDAWGLRRNPATWAPLASPFGGTEPLERGYTGHEHLDRVELIHMNGRVQDPRLGRFISPDPTVSDPLNTQSYDRYSYVRNNPVTLVDPSGFQEIYVDPHRVWETQTPVYGEDHVLHDLGIDPAIAAAEYESYQLRGITPPWGKSMSDSPIVMGSTVAAAATDALPFPIDAPWIPRLPPWLKARAIAEGVADLALLCPPCTVIAGVLYTPSQSSHNWCLDTPAGAASCPVMASEDKKDSLETDKASSPDINADDLRDKSKDELEQIARDKGLVQDPKRPNKWRDPITGKERLRIDPGHVDPRTGKPYDNPRASVPHGHGYDPAGNKIGDPSAGGDPHFPFKP